MSANVVAAASRDSLRRVWRIVRPRGGLGASSVLLASLSLLCAIGLIATSAWLISRAWQQPPIMYLGVAVVAVRAFGLGRGVFRYSERLVSHSAALRGLTRLRVALVERIAVVAPGGINSLRRGDAMRRFVDDVDSTAEYGLRAVFPRRTALVTGFVVIALMAWLLPSAALVVLVGLLIAGVLTPMITKRVGHAAAQTEVRVKGDLAAEVLSVLNASAEISAANAASLQVAKVVELDDRVLSAEKRTASSMGVAAALGMAAQGLSLIGVVLVAVPAVRAGQLDGVNLAVVVLLPLVVFEIVASLPAAALWQARAQASAERIVDVLDANEVVPDPAVTRSLTVWSVPPRLDVEVASVRWPSSDRDAVSGVSFQLPPGQRLAIVGPSGSGKSSLAAGLVKFAPMDGDVRIGGVGYSSLSGDGVRGAIGYCEQNAHIFDNTIAENLRLADRAATDEQLEEVLRRVKLMDWVQSLPHGMYTLVGEHGSQLSGGQRQRIAVARVLLSDHPIVILDEPTEHLDPVMAAELTADIFESLAGKSVIFITHTDEALAYVDQVLDVGASRYASDMTVVGS